MDIQKTVIRKGGGGRNVARVGGKKKALQTRKEDNQCTRGQERGGKGKNGEQGCGGLGGEGGRGRSYG